MRGAPEGAPWRGRSRVLRASTAGGGVWVTRATERRCAMTWLKLSDDYSDRTEYLGDAAFRLHTDALVAIMKREQGPHLTYAKVRRSTNVQGALNDALAELVGCGFWLERDGGYVVMEHMEHQPEPDVIAARRAAEAERQRRSRRKKAGLQPEPLSRRDDMRDDARDFGSGRVGTGRNGENSLAGADVEVPDPPVVVGEVFSLLSEGEAS